MPVYPTQAEPHDQPGQQAADAQYYRHVLHDLINMGTDLAHLLHQQAAAQAARQPPVPARQATEARPAPAPDAAPGPATDLTPHFGLSFGPDLTASFDRIARAVRRSIALARTLAEPIPLARNPAQHRAGVRKRIIREVEDAIQRASDNAERPGAERPDAESLRAELRDRLDAPDLDDDIATRPIAEIITEIRRDLGLASLPGDHPWKRRTPEDIQQLCARAAAPSRTRQPTAGTPGRDAAPHAPADPSPANPVPIGLAAIPRATGPVHASPVHASPSHVSPIHVSPIHAVSDAPGDAADLIATILHHPIHARDRWRPPPGA